MTNEEFNVAFTRLLSIGVELSKLKTEEMELRQSIFNAKFPTPKEGTNNAAIGNGYVLKGELKFNRKLDYPALLAIKPGTLSVPIDSFTKPKFDLILSAYKTLSPEDKEVVDEFITVTPGSPTLTLVPPKDKS